ncbi:MAG: DUF881 domain-containing protein [Pseudonocardiaceae bacterium]
MAEPPDSLLRTVLSDRLDPGYRAAAQRRGGAPVRGRAQRWWLVAGCLAAGVVLGVAARHAAALAPGADQATRGLVAEVVQARERTEDLGRRADELHSQLDITRARALAGDAAGRQLLAEVGRLEMVVAAVPVTGPGLRITVADPPAPAGSSTTRQETVLDRDLQVLLNALWSAGAEAAAVGGVRLHPLAAVRQAGGAMLVDNRPVGQPYVIEVVGDPERLQTNLIDTDGFSRFRTFAELYGTDFRIEPAEQLSLPAAAALTQVATPAAPTLEGNR